MSSNSFIERLTSPELQAAFTGGSLDSITGRARNSEFFMRWLLNASFDTITLLFTFTLVTFFISLFRLVFGLRRKDLGLFGNLRLLPAVLSAPASEGFYNYACRAADGTFMCSYEKHKDSHAWSRVTLMVAGLLGVLLLIFGSTIVFLAA